MRLQDDPPWLHGDPTPAERYAPPWLIAKSVPVSPEPVRTDRLRSGRHG